MTNYQLINLDNNMPLLKEILKKNNLLKYRFLITVEGRRYNYNQYYKIVEENSLEKKFDKEMENVEITIKQSNEIEMHIRCQGYQPYKCKYNSTVKEQQEKEYNFVKWLENGIIKVIDEMNNRIYG